MRQQAHAHRHRTKGQLSGKAESKHNERLCHPYPADGKVAGRYRKNHIPNIAYWEEGYYCSRGDLGFPVFPMQVAVIGIQMCWDNFYPEGSQILALKGAQVIFCPTACAFASQGKWEKVIAANAVNNGVFCLRVKRVGKENGLDFYGQSFCVDPEGEFIAGPSGLTDSVVLAPVDLSRIEDTRRTWNFFKERRPEIYGEVVGREWLKALKSMVSKKKEGHDGTYCLELTRVCDHGSCGSMPLRGRDVLCSVLRSISVNSILFINKSVILPQISSSHPVQ